MSNPYKTLPQVCKECRKLKMPKLGRFFRGGRYSSTYWICFDCLVTLKNFHATPIWTDENK